MPASRAAITIKGIKVFVNKYGYRCVRESPLAFVRCMGDDRSRAIRHGACRYKAA